MFERLEISKFEEEKCAWIMVGEPSVRIFQRRGTKQPSGQDDLASRCCLVSIPDLPSAVQWAHGTEMVDRCILVQQHRPPSHHG